VLRALIDAGTLSEDEVRANIKLFISGGLNEPRDVIATTLHALLADPEQESLGREDPENLARATEESLRWLSPIGMYPRVVHEDMELGGVTLPAGSRIGVLIASANRDERHWEDPDRFDLRRATVRHLAFSRGPHVCPGAYVARQQVARAALPELLSLPGIRLAGAVCYRGWVFRGPARLEVTWN
jgi:cytochrome P450